MRKYVLSTTLALASLFLVSINNLYAQEVGGAPLGGGNCADDELYTAIGCIPISSQERFVGWILRWGLGIGGGVAFLLILYAGFQLMTSQGDPKRIQAGKELLTSALGGLLLLIFSIFILRFLGVNILGLPEFESR